MLLMDFDGEKYSIPTFLSLFIDLTVDAMDLSGNKQNLCSHRVYILAGEGQTIKIRYIQCVGGSFGML